ncbi:signal peptidase I [Halomarina halobia]|uniref:Signal peptidase I n=1 Tax=Halomarina halobia TaxID=3033386 RepID=A0ABD6AC43_9EURY|nr:signal peptidase I [Halomarina sp. PSR21]
MRTLAGVVAIGVLAALVLLPATAPVHVSYVYSESMEPTIERGDGYLVLAAGEVRPGDIAVFRSSVRDEYVTHRVVGRTADGFVTKGDNNPTTDQAAGHPYVRRDAVVGTVLTVNGRPVTLPGFGYAVGAIRTHRPVALSLVGVLVAAWFVHQSGEPRRPTRSLLRNEDVIRPLFAASCLVLVGLVVLGGSTHTLTYVAITGQSASPRVVTVGESQTDHLTVGVAKTPLTRRIVTTEGMTITAQRWNVSAVELDVVVPGVAERGPHRAHVTVYKYPAVLPGETLAALQRVHAVLAAAVSSVLTLAPLYGAYALCIDGRSPIRLPRARWLRRRWGR